MEEQNMKKALSDDVIIEIVHSIKEVIILLIEKLCASKQIIE